ncbi:MAG: Na+/H+ antiporter subunit E [Firmicutes bacterium]|nr:Na+/H+ antiporter subunit E [Bacillota bacterium]
MLVEIFLSTVLALVWVGLTGDVSLPAFVKGLILGVIIIHIFGKRTLKVLDLNIRHYWPLVQLVFIFMYELLVANLTVLVKVFSPRLNIKPGIIKVPIEVEGPFWITTLANMITLTPGTLTVEVSPDNKFFYVHCLNIDNEESIVSDIKDTFEKKIQEVYKP